MLATLAQLKSWLDIEGATEDARLTTCLEIASAMIARECRRTIEYVDADLTELFDGGVRELLVRAWPITSVVSIKYASDYDFDSADALTADEDYRVVTSRGRIARLPLNHVWTEGIEVWQVVYRGGYWPAEAEGDPPEGVSELKDNLVKAGLMQATELWKRKDAPGYKMVEQMAGGAGSLGDAPDLVVCQAAKDLLVGERRVG